MRSEKFECKQFFVFSWVKNANYERKRIETVIKSMGNQYLQ